MSFKITTIEELMQLNRSQLQTALRVFQQELDGTIALLVQEVGARQDEHTLDELSNLLTLRKVFKLRLQELQELGEESKLEGSTSRRGLPGRPHMPIVEQYSQNELAPVS